MAGREISTQRRPSEVAVVDAGERDDRLLLKRMGVAKQFPRDEDAIRKRLRSQAPAKAEEWGYAWPVKNKRTGKVETVEGPSIKCANAVLAATPNIDVRVSVVDAEDAWIIEAALIDLENNNRLARIYRQRRSQRVMGDEDRNDDMLLALGQSKAIRNAVVNYLPELVDFAWEESRKSLLASVKKDPEKFKKQISARLDSIGVPIPRVAHWIGRGERAWTVEDMAKIAGAIAMVAEAVISADAMWPDAIERTAPPAPRPPPRREERDDEPPAAPPAGDIPEGPGE